LTVSRPIFAFVPVALVLVLSSCGGGDDSSKPAATATGPTATASKPPAGANSGTTGTTGTSGPERSKRTGNQGTAETETPSSSAGTRAKTQKRKGGGKAKKNAKSKGKGPGPRDDFTSQEWERYREAKTVCGGLGVGPLANQYHVEKDPGHVAAAYADAYAKIFGKGTRDAVYRGCKTGLAG
jgi:hypothetical protein